jgi:adenosylcobyric acid synthase
MSQSSLKVIVPVLPRISNHTDFDVLRFHPQVDLQFISLSQPIPNADLIILPGSKSVQADLAHLVNAGWKEAIYKHLRYGGKLIGICGGFQMLGNSIADPDQIEGKSGTVQGLGLLEMQTILTTQKQLKNVQGVIELDQSDIIGYEIHAGVSQGEALKRPFCRLDDGVDGAISEDNQIIGSYVHGLFDNQQSQQTLLNWAGLKHVESINPSAVQEDTLNRLADMCEANLDIDKIYSLLNLDKD